MVQSLEEKAAAIGSVLWLLEDHYRMVTMGRIGSCIQYVREGEPPVWKPPVVEEHDDWPVNAICQWIGYQRKVSKQYRLWPLGIALQKLEAAHPPMAAAVKARWVEIPPPNWYQDMETLAHDGLIFIAKDIPGDMPEWGGPRTKSVVEQVREMSEAGVPTREIARRTGFSTGYVRRLKRLLPVRSERKSYAIDGKAEL